MDLRVSDSESLAHLSPFDVRGYLVANQWTEAGRYGETARVFQRIGQNGKKIELIFPTTTDIDDYADRMKEILGILARTEERSELQIYKDLTVSGSDIFRLRAEDTHDDGSINIERANTLCREALSIVSAAALATNRPAKDYRGGKTPDRVEEYLNTVRVGQSELGSYVLPILSPVLPSLKPDQFSLFEDMDDEPFSRAVMFRLDAALGKLTYALQETLRFDSIEAFETAVEDGVSANLCQSVANLVSSLDGIEFSISWARSRPTRLPIKIHRFGRETAPALEEVVREFRKDQPKPEIRLFGPVVQLARDEFRFDGQFWIRSLVGNRVRKVKIFVDRPLYELVLKAHEEKIPITADGDLLKEKREWVMRTVTDLRLGDSDSDETDFDLLSE